MPSDGLLWPRGYRQYLVLFAMDVMLMLKHFNSLTSTYYCTDVVETFH